MPGSVCVVSTAKIQTQISLLDLLAAITGVGGDFNTLIGSAQSIRFVGGPQQLSQRLAARLGHRVRLGVEVTATRTARARDRPLGERELPLPPRDPQLPKTLVGRLRFNPALPPAVDQFVQRQPMGSVLKINAIYERPFWREAGLNGSATSEVGPIRITYDNSPPDGNPGVLVGFMEGTDSRRSTEPHAPPGGPRRCSASPGTSARGPSARSRTST